MSARSWLTRLRWLITGAAAVALLDAAGIWFTVPTSNAAWALLAIYLMGLRAIIVTMGVTILAVSLGAGGRQAWHSNRIALRLLSVLLCVLSVPAALFAVILWITLVLAAVVVVTVTTQAH